MQDDQVGWGEAYLDMLVQYQFLRNDATLQYLITHFKTVQRT